MAHWRRELSPVGAFNIGITCQGNPKYRGDRLRSIPLAQFAPLARLDGVQLFSLQKGPGTEQLHQGAGGFPVTDLGSQLDGTAGDFMDTAALMSSLYLIMTADTALAHLAGELGVPVGVALPLPRNGAGCCSARTAPGTPPCVCSARPSRWQGVFERMARAVGTMLAAGGGTAR